MIKENKWVFVGGMIIPVTLLVLAGCNITIPKIDVPTKPVVVTTTTTSTTTTQPPANVGVNYTKDFDWADAEKDNSTYFGGVEIRCLVNDNMMEHDAWITQLSREHNGMMMESDGTGSIKLTGCDFVTAHNKYHFEGWKISSSSRPLIKQASVLLIGGDKSGTTRGYWRTVK